MSGYYQKEGLLFKVEPSDKHLLCIAEKIAKKKNIEIEKLDETSLFIYSTEVDFQKEVQHELNKLVHVKK